MNESSFVALREEDGRIHIVQLIDQELKTRGLGVFNSKSLLADLAIGEWVMIGHKSLQRVPTALPELNKGMIRRAQTISAKDAGVIIARLGIGAGDTILEAGLGSGALSLHLARVLGNEGIHVTVEPKTVHAEVGLQNLSRAQHSWSAFPTHLHFEGTIEETIDEIGSEIKSFDSIILDLPEHASAIQAVTPWLKEGGRLVCYCPVTQQVDAAWEACEAHGLEVEWAGELMERQWGRASKGGLRPVNGPFGHTAFLVFAQKITRQPE